MKALRHIYGSPTAIIGALVLFGVPTFAVWYWGDIIGVLLAYGVHTPIDSAMFHRTVLFAQVLLTALLFLLQYAVFAQAALRERFDPPFSQAVVSDLMLSREQFRMLYDNSPIPYFLIDDEGNIRNPNLAALRFLEGARDELLASNLFTLAGEQGPSAGKIHILHTKMERNLPIHNVKVSLKTLQGNDRFALVTIFAVDQTAPLPFKHLVTLVEAQENENEAHTPEESPVA
jgi:PAS domain-containing protein